MRYRRVGSIAALLVIAGTFGILTACDDPLAPPPNALIGTWNAISLDPGNGDVVSQGMGLSIQFTADNEYFLNITNDLISFCEGATSCSDDGEFEASDTQITFDPGTEFEGSVSYSIIGNTLTFSGLIDFTPLSGTLTRN